MRLRVHYTKGRRHAPLSVGCGRSVRCRQPSTPTACSSPKKRPCRPWPCSTTRSPSPSTTRWPSPASSRPSATTPTGSSKPPTSSPCPRAPPSTSSPCGSTARKPTASSSRPTRPREIYTVIVRRTQDPGLLEYIGNNLLRLRVFPVPPNGDQKVALSFTSVAAKDGKLVEYIYPLKTDGKATSTLEEFSHHRHHQEPARRHQRLQPHARHHPQAQERQGSRPSASTRTRDCWTRTSSCSTPPATRTSA